MLNVDALHRLMVFTVGSRLWTTSSCEPFPQKNHTGGELNTARLVNAGMQNTGVSVNEKIISITRA